jgi:SAM-dependent methyltransferase
VSIKEHRSYVGPGESYDLIAAMTFNLLTSYGLRGHHRVLDIGCGSLRNGRLLIQYLDAGNYVGVEPNYWLLDDAMKYETGNEIMEMKQTTFIVDNKIEKYDNYFDYVFAQSIFSHAGFDIMGSWFQDIKRVLKPDGFCFFTYFKSVHSDKSKTGWAYPDCVKHCIEDIKFLADELSMEAFDIYVPHPHDQQWVQMMHLR